MKHPEEQQLNFLGFIESFIGPAERDLEYALAMQTVPVAAHYARAALIEAAYWLFLGASIGYFGREESLLAIRSIVSNPELNMQEFLLTWGYLINPFLHPQYESWVVLPDSIGDYSVSFESDDAAQILFGSFIRQAGRFTRNRTAQAFIVLINFYTRDDLHKYLRGTPVFPEDLSRALGSGSALNPKDGEVLIDGACLGFGNWLDYLSAFREHYENNLEGGWISSADLRKLLQYVSRMQSWRLHGLSSGSLAAVDARDVVISAITRAYGLSADQAAGLQTFMLDVIAYWEGISAEVHGASG